MPVLLNSNLDPHAEIEDVAVAAVRKTQIQEAYAAERRPLEEALHYLKVWENQGKNHFLAVQELAEHNIFKLQQRREKSSLQIKRQLSERMGVAVTDMDVQLYRERCDAQIELWRYFKDGLPGLKSQIEKLNEAERKALEEIEST